MKKAALRRGCERRLFIWCPSRPPARHQTQFSAIHKRYPFGFKEPQSRRGHHFIAYMMNVCDATTVLWPDRVDFIGEHSESVGPAENELAPIPTSQAIARPSDPFKIPSDRVRLAFITAIGADIVYHQLIIKIVRDI